MAYDPTVWRNGQSPFINSQNLNHIEQGIVDAHEQNAAEADERAEADTAEATARAEADTATNQSLATLQTELDAHEAKTDNPHGVTANQVGAVAKSGDTMTGLLTLSGDPASALNPVTLQYLNALMDGRDPKENVRAATTANIALSGLLTIDGVILVSGNRVLVKNQTTASQNGIYVAASGAWTRSSDTNTATKISGMYVYVAEGATLGETGWSLYTDGAITLGTTALTYGQTYGPGSVQAGDGLTRNGNSLAVNPAVYPKGATAGASADNLWVFDQTSGGWLPKSRAGAGVAERNNSRGTASPSDPVPGQLWLDTATNPPTLKAYSGSAWQAVGGGGASASVVQKLRLERNTTAQTLSHATWTAIGWNVEAQNPGNWWTSATPTRITPPAGIYLLYGFSAFASNSTGGRFSRITKNGVDVVAQSEITSASATDNFGRTTISGSVRIESGDYIEYEAIQQSGGNLGFAQQANSIPYIEVVRLA